MIGLFQASLIVFFQFRLGVNKDIPAEFKIYDYVKMFFAVFSSNLSDLEIF